MNKPLMDWNLAINRNREALLRVIAALYVLIGVPTGTHFECLPRHLYHTVLRVLRAAESATRRLIIIAARNLVSKPVLPRTLPTGLIVKGSAPQKCIFPLIDPLKRFTPSLQYAHNFDSAEGADKASIVTAIPRISVPGFYDPVLVTPRVDSPDDLLNAAHLSRRLDALIKALSNLPSQARRLVRWHARRAFARQNGVGGLGRFSPFRPGSPPGIRQRSSHEVHAILIECHALAREVYNQQNTT